MTYLPAPDRYDGTTYARCGRSGLQLPRMSFGLWHNFGHDRPYANSQAIVRRAFDLGITHFDLANNYGVPYGSAEETFGRLLRDDLAPYRDELVISTKAGYDMWPGPYGEWGSRKYLLASLDQSLGRMGLDYVDIFYSHRFDPDTPLEETMGALATAVQQGKALYAGISSYTSAQTREAAAILRGLGIPLLIHQPSYSLLNRWLEDDGLLDTLGELGVGCICFSSLAQGVLTDKYLHGIPEGSRASRGLYLSPADITEDKLGKMRALNEIALGRGQSLAQMALAWTLRDERMTSVLIGASSVEQLEDNVAALDGPPLTAGELAEIDRASSVVLRRIDATRYVTPLREGGSLPALIEASDDGLYVLKFRGAGQGPKALVAEVVAGELARALGFRVPELALVELDPALGVAEPDPEIQDLLQASPGLNLGVDFLPGALPFSPAAGPAPDPEQAADVVWLDALVTNVDRTAQNTNLLLWHDRLWLIDHGAALYFHHAAPIAGQERTPFAAIDRHVLLPFAGSIAEADGRLAPQVTRELLEEIAAAVPAEWLNGEDPQLYVEYLAGRLAEPRAFVAEAERARGR